jgi:CDP-diglyceride synthetase
MVPIIDLLARSPFATWLGVTILAALSAWLFRLRRKLRTSFFLPLLYAPLLAAFHFRVSDGIDTPRFTWALLLFFALCVVAGLTDAFWSPYRDDLEDLEYSSRFKE